MKKPLAIFFLALEMGCAAIPAPRGMACAAFVRNGQCTNLCFDMDRDFDQSGNPRPDARAKRMPCSLETFDKRVNFDADSFAELKAFALKSKAACEAK